MIYQLENEFLSVGINTYGAEMENLIKDGVNRIWTRDEFWPKQSPVLFPMIGKTKDNYYTLDGNRYEVPTIHGFAPTSEFKVIENTRTNTYIELCLTQNEETLKMFPFNFTFIVSYELVDNKVITNWYVTNNSKDDMYFTVGGHPSFRYDTGLGETYLDYIVKFDEPVEYKLFGVEASLMKEQQTFANHKKSFFEMNDLIKKHITVIFENLDNATLISNSGKSVRIDCKNVPYLAFWHAHATETPMFMCMEPWCGIPDFMDHDHNFKTKKSNICISANETYTNGYTITLD